MLDSIPLQAVPNQQLTIGLNKQTFNLTITSGTVNGKPLQNETPDIDETTKIYTFATIYLGDVPIIQNTICNHAVYINQYPSAMKGYFFFYVNGGSENNGNDQVIYTGFNNNINLYYADYDVLAIEYTNWVNSNKIVLEQRFIFDVSN